MEDKVNEVKEAIKGAKFPASREDLMAKAKDNKAPQEAMDMLNDLPEQQYQSWDDVLDAIGGGAAQ